MTFLDYVTRAPYHDIEEEEIDVLESPGFAALPELVRSAMRRRVGFHAEDVASAGAMWVDSGSEGDVLEGPRLKEAAEGARAAKAAFDTQWGDEIASALRRNAELGAEVDGLMAQLGALSELNPPPDGASMDRIASQIERLRKAERELAESLGDALDALAPHTKAAERMVWPPEEGSEEARAILTEVYEYDESTLRPLRVARAGNGHAEEAAQEWVRLWLAERPRLTAEAAVEAARERAAREAARVAQSLAYAAAQRQRKEEHRAYQARLWEEELARREQVRKENAALLSGNSGGSRWYSSPTWNTNSRSTPSQSWSSKYLSSDAQLRDYRRQLDHRIYGTRY